MVSPTSIRSRILKVLPHQHLLIWREHGFTHVDPFEDTESAIAVRVAAHKQV